MALWRNVLMNKYADQVTACDMMSLFWMVQYLDWWMERIFFAGVRNWTPALTSPCSLPYKRWRTKTSSCLSKRWNTPGTQDQHRNNAKTANFYNGDVYGRKNSRALICAAYGRLRWSLWSLDVTASVFINPCILSKSPADLAIPIFAYVFIYLFHFLHCDFTVICPT